MAIFRGGKRVGPFDIRMGFPRDRSLENVDRDPRMWRPANTDNTVGRFRSAMARADGYARPARFAVALFPPTGLKKLVQSAEISSPENQDTRFGGNLEAANSGKSVKDLTQLMGQQMNIHCDSVTMPGHDLTAETVEHFGPTRNIVTGHGFTGTITASFYADKFLRERHFLEMWQKLAVGMTNHKAGYYNDYVGKMHIYQLGAIAAEGDRDVPTYAIEAIEVYPETISAIDYSYGSSNQIVKINVNFQYKEWYNLASDKINGVSMASALQVLPEQPGMPGILDRLPPELRRAGRDVFNQARTQFPIGKLFKGKVFPPFTT